MDREPTPSKAMRADIRRLGHELGEAIARQEGQRRLDRVEEVLPEVFDDVGGRNAGEWY